MVVGGGNLNLRLAAAVQCLLLSFKVGGCWVQFLVCGWCLPIHIVGDFVCGWVFSTVDGPVGLPMSARVCWHRSRLVGGCLVLVGAGLFYVLLCCGCCCYGWRCCVVLLLL